MTEYKDKRVLYTRQTLKASMLKLLEKLPLEKITVKGLCEFAGINRSTFYAHYNEPKDILNELTWEVISQLKRHLNENDYLNPTQDTKRAMTELLTYIEQNQVTFKILLYAEYDHDLFEAILLMAQDQIVSASSRYAHLSEREQQYIKHFAVSGTLSVLKAWLEDHCPESPKVIAELIASLLYH